MGVDAIAEIPGTADLDTARTRPQRDGQTSEEVFTLTWLNVFRWLGVWFALSRSKHDPLWDQELDA